MPSVARDPTSTTSHVSPSPMAHARRTRAGHGLPRLKTDLKLAGRIHRRYRDHGDTAGLAYAVQLVRQMPHVADQLYALMPASRADTIRDEVARQQAAKATQQAAKAAQQATQAAHLQAQQAQATQVDQARRATLTQGLETARQAAVAVSYLAGLSPADRDLLATKAERRAAIALRKTAMLKGKVLAALGCTATELERWHADGRLPHVFTRVLRLEVAGKAQPCRFWAQETVMAAQGQVAVWRARDQGHQRGRSVSRRVP
jgi:hypothetical protein